MEGHYFYFYFWHFIFPQDPKPQKIPWEILFNDSKKPVFWLRQRPQRDRPPARQPHRAWRHWAAPHPLQLQGLQAGHQEQWDSTKQTEERTTWKNSTWMSSSLAIIASFWGILTERILRITKIYVKGERAPWECWVSMNNCLFLNFHEIHFLTPQLCFCGRIYNHGKTSP